MNCLLLAIAFRAWSGSALAVFLRVMAAIAVFSIEVQLATWLQAGTIRSLQLLNLALAAASVSWTAWQRSRLARLGPPEGEPGSRPESRPHAAGDDAEYARLPPLAAAVAALAVAVIVLAMMRPVTGADSYHLHRVNQVTSLGTLAYDPAVPDVKINALAGVYELLLADLRIPGLRTALVRLHGVFGLGMYLLAIAAVAPWLRVRRRWPLIVFLVVPVVFHQLVLVKNDLFGALPAFVALAWVVTRGPDMSLRETAAAAALAGWAVGIKISSAPVALVVAAFVAVDRRADWRHLGATVAGGVAGAVAGGLLFTLVENARVYGGAMQPYLALDNRNEAAGDAFTGIGRFAVSLVDLGRVTPRIWPGRGGWGSTFGLPMVWALAALGLHARDRTVRRAIVAAGACMAAFAASYPDADIAQRMVIGPGLLLLAVAVATVDGDDRVSRAMRRVLIGVIALSALQIARSAMLYLTAS